MLEFMTKEKDRYLQFLGTAAADYEGIEKSENKNCRDATRLGGRNLRSSSSLFIYPDCIIDFSSKVPLQMRRFNINPGFIRYILITHPHSDHFHPSSIIRTADENKNSFLVCGNSWTIKLLKMEAESLKSHIVKTKLFRPTQEYKLGDICIVPVEANHVVEPGEFFSEVLSNKTGYPADKDDFKKNKNVVWMSLNYIIKTGNKTILYACDTGLPFEETYLIYRRFKFDIVIHEATFENTEMEDHMNFRKVRSLRRKMIENKIISQKTRFIITHLSLNYTPVYDKIRKKILKDGVIVGYDGMIIPL